MSPTPRSRVAVIGAGPAGLACAYRLARAGVSVEVFEAGDAVGGLARTIDLWGQKADLGPHRFLSDDARVNGLWLEVVGRDYAMVRRLTRIYYRGRFFHYPLRPVDVLTNLGVGEAAACVMSFAAGHARGRLGPRAPEREPSFEDWVVARFGRRLFETFFRAYSEKLWGLPCGELDADFAAQRIRTLSLAGAIAAALFRRGRAKHRTLADEFAYPLGGTGMVYERMAAAVRAAGGAVHLRTPVERVVTAGGRAVGVALAGGSGSSSGGVVRPADHVVSTMPLTLLVRGLDGVPAPVRAAADALAFRNTILVYLLVEATDLFPDNWLYVHSPDLGVGRITNFRNWVPTLHGGAPSTILALEYWCSDGDARWSADDAALVALAARELRATGLCGAAPIRDGHVRRIRRCYPVYRRGYRTHLKTIEDHLRSLAGLHAIGRYGAFKYNNQDHSLLMGLLAADNIAAGAAHDLFAVNSDHGRYQEAAACSITEAGLVTAARS